VIRLDPDNAHAYAEIGLIYEYSLLDAMKAIEAFKEAIRRKPSYAMAHLHLGMVYLKIGDIKSAKEVREHLRILGSHLLKKNIGRLTFHYLERRNNMSLEKFTRQQSPDWPAVTVRKNGTLCINSKAADQFQPQGARFATLHFDKKEGIMGIKPLDDESDPAAVRISKEKNRTFVISCQAF